MYNYKTLQKKYKQKTTKMYDTEKKQSNSTNEKKKTDSKHSGTNNIIHNKKQQLKRNENISIIDDTIQIPLKLYFHLYCDWQPILFFFEKMNSPPSKNITKSIWKKKYHKHNSSGHTEPVIANTTITLAHVSLTVVCVAKTTTQQPKQFLLLIQQQK